jgi:hypothetical protein
MTEDLTPAELEQRRREIVLSLTTQYSGYDDPAVPLTLLQELAVITSTLRRKNAGPPKRRAANGKKQPSIDDLDI